MNWVNRLLDRLLETDRKEHHFSFSGKADDNIEHRPEWEEGFDDGYWYTMKYWKLGEPFEFPEGWGTRGTGWYGNGFAEGNISARNQIIDRDYPNLSSIQWIEGYRYRIVFKDGREIIIGK